MILQSHPSDAAAWTVIAASRCVLALPVADAARLPDLAERLAGDDGFRAALQTLVGAGIADAPSFALIDGDAQALRVVLRGEASVRVTGSQDAAESTVSGSGMATWAERVLEGVGSLRLQVPGSTWTLTLSGGVPAAAAVVPTAPGVVVPEAPAAPEASAAPAAPAAPTAPVENTLVPSAEIGPVPVPPEPVPPAPVAPVVAPAPAASAPAAAAPAAPEPADSDDVYDFLFGNTIYRTQAGEILIPNPDPERPGDHDGRTMLAEELGLRGHVPEQPIDDASGPETSVVAAPAVDQPEHSAPSEATVFAPVGLAPSEPGVPTPVPPTLAVAPTLQLERADGGRESLRAPVLIGRAPSASVSSGPAPRLITIADDKDISRSHVRVAVEGDAVVVTDLASKNGTVVTLPGAAPRKLRGGEPTVVLPGTLIDLGGGVTFTVRED